MSGPATGSAPSSVPGYDEQAQARWATEGPKMAPAPGRSPFARDRARVLHAAALRRLAGKTQVVGPAESDFPRTRLTHTLECAQIGREIAAALGADPDLVDAACLAHDLGHPPFGHNGELALDAIAATAGGFEGNAQSLRLLTRLEVKITGAGLNLTRATLDAACKYPWVRPPAGGKFGAYADDRPAFDWFRSGAVGRRRPVESQIMEWCDDVAYSVHDFEDGVHARAIDPGRIDVDAVLDLAGGSYLPGSSAADLAAAWGGLLEQPWWVRSFDGSPPSTAALKEMTSELIGRFARGAVTATRAAAGPEPLTRYAADMVVPDLMRLECGLLKAVAAHHVMHARRAMQGRQRKLITELVDALVDRGRNELDPLLRPAYDAAADDSARLRVVIDQVAGLTDASAVTWHGRLVR